MSDLTVNVAAAMDPPFALIASEVVPLTRELAQQFRDMPGSPTERTLNPSRVKHLKEKAMAGQLIPFQWATAECEGQTYRMNGQHSSEMVCELDGLPSNGTVVLQRYRVADRNGLALLFRQFDDRRSSRTPADIAGAYQGLEDDLRDLDRKRAKLAIEGIAWYQANVEKVDVPKGDARYQWFHDASLHPFIKWVAGSLLSSKTPELNKPAVVAAIFGTWLANREHAERFWEDVAREGDQFSEDAPSTAVDRWLLANFEEPDPTMKPANFYQGCIFAWNAYRQGRQITAVKSDAKKSFFRIAE
jgi:hypothetical protein